MAPEFSGPVQEIRRLFADRGGSGYGGEAVSQLQHALQAAHLARESGASDNLVAAALLHDVGHLLHDLPDEAPDSGIDDRHEGLAARWLSRWFGPEVVEPVRLHVAAKRFLCAVDPAYFASLSLPSQVSLQLQGGPMADVEVEHFRCLPHHEAAVSLRRWDDLAKDPDAEVPGIDAYLPLLEQALTLREGPPAP
ncbi:phosphonate degradation HD-domain oxygenase [Tautonia sociabilis]|uniref:HD domain-containing protein n=1 Tax=Tautonia sociabilis TaxID=2080755 RepID=A0A432MP20_9BACT|nr:phosphonate degradation HD-domain oxygenase [Tautonia sociabilis]RUL89184.1 HD domain-containing protein [Tautonia sociabilis]